MSIGIETKVPGDFAETIEKTIEALKAQGFGILTRIDVKPVLKEKLDVDFINYTILGACNPPLAHEALNTSLDIGLLLPCNVVVYEKEPGTITVSAINPHMMMDILPGIDLSSVANTAAEKLTAAIGTL